MDVFRFPTSLAMEKTVGTGYLKLSGDSLQVQDLSCSFFDASMFDWSNCVA